VVREELPANIDSKHVSMNEIGRDGIRVHLFTAFHTIDPEMRGTMWVKLKPESMTNMHSGGGGRPPSGVLCGAVNKEPWGISDAAVNGETNQGRVFLVTEMDERVHLWYEWNPYSSKTN